MKPGAPRLGFIGVRREWRRRGVARALVARVLIGVRDYGVSEVRTEVDEHNVPSKQLLLSFGGREVGALLELVRDDHGRLPFRLRQSIPEERRQSRSSRFVAPWLASQTFVPPGSRSS